MTTSLGTYVVVVLTKVHYNSFISDWLEASQAFAIIGFLVLIVALVLTIVVIFLKDMKVLKLIAWILCFVAGKYKLSDVAI